MGGGYVGTCASATAGSTASPSTARLAATTSRRDGRRRRASGDITAKGRRAIGASVSAERGDGAASSRQRQAAVRLQEHLRRTRPAVVGRAHHRRVGPDVGDRHEVAALERWQVVVAERVGRLADGAVDARSGPATSAPSAAADGRPSDVSATIGWRRRRAPGRMSSVIPVSRTTAARRDRARGGRDPTSQPARATRKRPGSTAQRSGRRSAGIVLEDGRDLAGEPRRARDRLAGGATGKPPPTSSVSKAGSPPRTKPMSARQRRTASRQASMAPSCEPTCRWIPRGRTERLPAARSTASVSSVSVIPNFDAPAPTARPACVSGATSGFERKRTSSGGRRRPVPARRIGERDQRAPAHRPIRRPPTPVASHRLRPGPRPRRSASVLPTPSSVIASFGTPARRAIAHSPAETTFAPRPRPASRADDRRDVVRLDRVAPMPRVGEGVGDRVGGGVERGDVGDERGRAEPLRGRSERRCEQRDAIRERCPGAGRTGRGRGRPYVT